MRTAINVLAGYRLLRLIQLDTITLHLRERVWGWLSDHQRFRSLRSLLTCPWCAGVWLAGIVIFADAYMGLFWDVLAKILALSAVIGLLGYLDQEHIG